jgi:cation diffusion facilitator family transporter
MSGSEPQLLTGAETAEAAAGRDAQRRAIRAANVSILSNTTLVIGKFVVGVLVGSTAIVSEGLHSSTDLLAAFMARYAVGKSRAPADDRHPHGHGKVDSLSGTAEGVLVLAAAGLIWMAAGHRLASPHPPVSESPWGIAVMAFSAVMNIIVSGYLFRVARSVGSVALEADGVHLRADVWTSVGVVAGLIAIRVLPDYQILDPLVAILVGAVIGYEGWAISRRALGQLLDEALPADDLAAVRAILADHYGTIAGFHKLRSRRAGPHRYVDVHVEMCRKMPLFEAHEVCTHLEEEVGEALRGTDILIHPEPCDGRCERGTPPEDLAPWCRLRRQQLAAAVSEADSGDDREDPEAPRGS